MSQCYTTAEDPTKSGMTNWGKQEENFEIGQILHLKSEIPNLKFVLPFQR